MSHLAEYHTFMTAVPDWANPTALVDRLNQVASSAREMLDTASDHYTDSLQRVGSAQQQGGNNEQQPNWSLGQPAAKQAPPKKLGKVSR